MIKIIILGIKIIIFGIKIIILSQNYNFYPGRCLLGVRTLYQIYYLCVENVIVVQKYYIFYIKYFIFYKKYFMFYKKYFIFEKN